MARFVVGAVFGLVVGVVAGAAAGTRADEDLEALAAEAGVDATDLAGATNTTGMPARQYLARVGELPAAAAAAQPAGAAAVSGVWPRLAQCESTGRWNVNSGNGYFGGLQFDLPTWRAYGGLAYASRPDLASPSAQVAVAEKLHAARGFQPWPVCSRKLGLR